MTPFRAPFVLQHSVYLSSSLDLSTTISSTREGPKGKKPKKKSGAKDAKANKKKKSKKKNTKKDPAEEKEEAEKERMKKMKQEANKARAIHANPPQLSACFPTPSQVITSLSRVIRETNDKISELSGMCRAKHA